jgi:hypothetical protein
MHTKTVKEMLPKIDQNLFHPLNDKMTLEFFLWSAYLDHRGIKDQLYFPVQPLSGYLFDACPKTLN